MILGNNLFLPSSNSLAPQNSSALFRLNTNSPSLQLQQKHPQIFYYHVYLTPCMWQASAKKWRVPNNKSIGLFFQKPPPNTTRTAWFFFAVVASGHCISFICCYHSHVQQQRGLQVDGSHTPLDKVKQFSQCCFQFHNAVFTMRTEDRVSTSTV